ncbi:hypothetical protein Btru_047958 [Bulinus truncatus]|nr:hypothetical protein Btru_047958 [Bulinus truncatus]
MRYILGLCYRTNRPMVKFGVTTLTFTMLAYIIVEGLMSARIAFTTPKTSRQVHMMRIASFHRNNETHQNELPFCKSLEVDPFDPDIMKLSGVKKAAVVCSGFMPDLTYINGSRLQIDHNRLKGVRDFKFCRYRNIKRHAESDKDFTFGEWSEEFTNNTNIPENAEFILVVCQSNSSGNLSKTYHALVPRHEKDITMDLMKQKKRQSESRPKETLNIIMIGMDGTSRHQMMRGMNKTYTFLMEELHSIEMKMYSQVGSNTFPNLVPLLTGTTEKDVEQWWDNKKHFDPLDTIWKDFSNAGYRTLFSEDYPSIGAFHYLKKGFDSKPTTYYSRPISLAIERDSEIWQADGLCIGNTPEILFHYNYLNSFLMMFKGSPVFATLFMKKYSHDDMTDNRKADLNTYNFYKSLQENNYLNNTLLISFSDHGPRWGYIRNTPNGMVESRAPYAIFTFPRWFLDKYPDVAENLRINSMRLTTHFDTHAMLRELLYFKASGKIPLVPTNYGISLFREVPKNRTCSDAFIPLEFCLCDQEIMEYIPSAANISKGLAELLVRAVNSKRSETICAELKVGDIQQTITLRSSSLNSNDNKRWFKIRIRTEPGGAVYEGTVRTKVCEDVQLVNHLDQLLSGNKSNPFEVTVGETIDRLNLYKGQADCETDSFKKPYCYCKILLPDKQ